MIGKVLLKVIVVAVAFSNGLASAQSFKTQWRYGEGVCAGGWWGLPFWTCEDKSLPPISQTTYTNKNICGSEIIEERNKTCRRAEFGPLEVIPNTKEVKSKVLEKRLQPLGMLGPVRIEFEKQCQTAGLNDLPDVSGHYAMRILVSSSVGKVSFEEERDPFPSDGDLFSKKPSIFSSAGLTPTFYKFKATCTLEFAKAQYPEKADPLCGVIPREEKINTCTQTVYQVTSRKECGYVPNGPNLSSMFSDVPLYKTDRIECLTADNMPDETPEQLIAKVKYLLSPVFVAEQDRFRIITERRQAMLKFILKHKSALLPQDLIDQIWQLNAMAKLPSSSEEAISKEDISVFLTENLTENPGSPLQFTERTLYVSMPNYTESASVCFASIEDCKREGMYWDFMPLAKSDGAKYYYILNTIQNIGSVFTVRGFRNGQYTEKEVERGTAEKNAAFDKIGIRYDDWKVWFSYYDNEKLLAFTSGNRSERNIPFQGFPDNEAKFFYYKEEGKFVRHSLAAGSLDEVKWDVPGEYSGQLLAGEGVLLHNGVSFYNPLNAVTFRLEGVSNAIGSQSFRGSKDYITADIGDHKVGVWSALDGRLVNTISYPSTSASGQSDYFHFTSENIIGVLSEADHKFWTYAVDGRLLSTFTQPMDRFFPSSDGKLLYAGGASIKVLEAGKDQPLKTITWGDRLSRVVIGTDAAQETVFVQSFFYSQELNKWQSFAIEAWNLETGLMLVSRGLQPDLPLGSLRHQTVEPALTAPSSQ